MFKTLINAFKSYILNIPKEVTYWDHNKKVLVTAILPKPAWGFEWQLIVHGTQTVYEEVCNTCGGNCGQCGTSRGHGLPASMNL